MTNFHSYRVPFLVGLVALVTGVLVASCWPEPDPAAPVAQWRSEVQAYREQVHRLGPVLLKLADSARTEGLRADRAEARAQQAERVAHRAEAKVEVYREQWARDTTVRDSLDTAIQVIAAQDSVIQGYRVAFAEAKQAGARLRVANQLLTEANDSLAHALDRATGLLGQGLAVVPKPCRVLWMECPSRTTSFVVGAVLGVAGTVALGVLTP